MSESFSTKVLHSLHIEQPSNSKATPIYQTSAFTFNNLEELEGFYEGKSPYLYSRMGNPNTDELGNAVAALENAPAGVAASSGISAILAGVLSVCKVGDHIVAADDIYGGTYHLFKEELTQFGIEVTFVSFTDGQAVKKSIKENTKLLYSESITNPLLRVENMYSFLAIAREFKLKTMIDNTFATPFLLRPYELGVDLVVHSATKYIGGHSDVTAGVVVGEESLLQVARQKVVSLGANVSPFEAWLTCRGLKTMALRMEKQCANAQTLAEALSGQAGVQNVYYPTDFSEKGNGAMVSITLEENYDIHTFFRSLGWVKIVPTLAGVETTVSYPLGTSHRALPPEDQQRLGITKNTIRISVGIEEASDITKQFLEAIEKSKS